MPTIPFGYGHVIIPIEHAALSRAAVITYGIDMNGASGSADMADKHLANFDAAWGSHLDSNCTAGPATLYVGQPDDTNVVYVGTDTIVGEGTTERINPSNNLLLRKQTARGGRRGRGRMFIPWVLGEVSVNETGRVDAAIVTAFQSVATLWLTDIGTSEGTVVATPMVLLHSPSDPDEVANPTPEGSPNEVLSLIVDNIVGMQRRRLGR